MYIIKFLLVLVSISTYCFIGAEGFVAGTYVKVPNGYETIDKLNPHDKVISYDFNQSTTVERSIVEISKQYVDRYIRLVAHDSIIEVSPEQKFYLHALKKWETIDTIKNNPELLHILYTESHIAYLGDIDQECDVYMLTLDEPHNFFITPHGILVHNFLAAQSLAAIGGSLIGWAGYQLFGKRSRRYRANDRSITCDLDQIKGSPRPNDPEDPENKWSNWWNKVKRCLTNKEARELAELLGFHEIKDAPFNSFGELVFKKDTLYISPDKYGHRGGVWKLFQGDNRLGTFDALLKNRIGK
jgi:hypothetical protein